VKLFKTRHIIPILLAAVLVVATGCSTQKNTARTRWWHSFKARYNTYYNGSLAYIDASLEKEEGNKEIADWCRSLTLRGINLPDQIKDETFMLREG
jgi:hypothetical protein